MVTGYDPTEHGGDILPWEADWAPPAVADRLRDHWTGNGPPPNLLPDLLHLFLGPAASAQAAALGDPHSHAARQWAATVRASGLARRQDRAEALAALAVIDPSLTARELAVHAAEFVAHDLDVMAEDFVWATGDVLLTAGSLAIERPTLARETATFVDIVRKPRTIRHASTLRSRWALPADLAHPVALFAVHAWEDAGANPQRAARWVNHGVWHPRDAHDYHEARIAPHVAVDELGSATESVMAYLAPKSSRAEKVRRAITRAANEEGFAVSAVAQAIDHIDPAVVATCRRLALGLGTAPFGRFGLAQRLFARVRPLARQAADR